MKAAPMLRVDPTALRGLVHAMIRAGGSAETAGHGTTGQARFWRDALGDFLKEVP